MTKTIKISPNSDNMTPAFQSALQMAQNSDDQTVIELERGDYYFKRSGSEKMRIFSSGGKSCENFVLFPIIDTKNLTIEGNGAQFIYCDRVQPFFIKNSENITLRNFSVDYSFYRYAYAEVISTTDDGFEIFMDKKQFHYFIEDGFLNFVCGEDVLSTRNRQISMRRFAPSKTNVKYLRVGSCEAPIHKAAPNIYVDAIQTNQGVFLKYRAENDCMAEYKVGDTIILAYDNAREAQAFYCEFSKNLCLENICIYRNGGMGFVADMCESIILDKFHIRKKEGRKEYFTSTADGIFLTNCNGNFTLKNSYISDTYDDAINIHGFYTEIKEVLSGNKVKLSHLYPSHWGIVPYLIGDQVHISDPQTLQEKYVLKVTDISYDEDRSNIILTFAESVDLCSGMLIENPDRTPNVVIENNTIKRAPHMRLSARNMLIKNNDLSLEINDIFIHDLINFWGESGAVERVEICGNKFDNTCKPNVSVRSYRPSDSNHLHENIIIKDNIFKNSREDAIKISCANNVVETGNQFNRDF